MKTRHDWIAYGAGCVAASVAAFAIGLTIGFTSGLYSATEFPGPLSILASLFIGILFVTFWALLPSLLAAYLLPDHMGPIGWGWTGAFIGAGGLTLVRMLSGMRFSLPSGQDLGIWAIAGAVGGLTFYLTRQRLNETLAK